MLYTDDNLVDPKHSHPLSFLDQPEWVKVVGHGSVRRLINELVGFVPNGYSQYTITGSTQQSAIADALTGTAELWMNGMLNASTKGHGSVLQRLDAVHTIQEGHFQPYTTASCALDALNGSYDDGAVSFPVPSGVPDDTWLNTAEINDSI